MATTRSAPGAWRHTQAAARHAAWNYGRTTRRRASLCASVGSPAFVSNPSIGTNVRMVSRSSFWTSKRRPACAASNIRSIAASSCSRCSSSGSRTFMISRIIRRFDRCAVLPKPLLELLSWPQPRKDDRDLAQAEAGQLDQVLGQIDDADRLAHVQHEELAAQRHTARFDHEVHGFGNRHEVARDIRMRDAHRSTLFDLMLEGRNHASAASEHVAEANDHELPTRRCGGGPNDGLRQTLGRTHHARRRHGLVRGHEHQPLRPGLSRDAHDIPGAHDVVRDGLLRVVLHERQVLVRGRVEHDRWLDLLEHRTQSCGVAAHRQSRPERLLLETSPAAPARSHRCCSRRVRARPAETVMRARSAGRAPGRPSPRLQLPTRHDPRCRHWRTGAPEPAPGAVNR